jgi:hypothetical protein
LGVLPTRNRLSIGSGGRSSYFLTVDQLNRPKAATRLPFEPIN